MFADAGPVNRLFAPSKGKQMASVAIEDAGLSTTDADVASLREQLRDVEEPEPPS